MAFIGWEQQRKFEEECKQTYKQSHPSKASCRSHSESNLLSAKISQMNSRSAQSMHQSQRELYFLQKSSHKFYIKQNMRKNTEKRKKAEDLVKILQKYSEDQARLNQRKQTHQRNVWHFQRYRKEYEAIIKQGIEQYSKDVPVLNIIFEPHSPTCQRNREKSIEGLVDLLRRKMKRFKETADKTFYEYVLAQNRQRCRQYPRLKQKMGSKVDQMQQLINIDFLVILLQQDYLYQKGSQHYVHHHLQRQFEELTSISKDQIKKLGFFYAENVKYINASFDKTLQVVVMLLILVKAKFKIHSLIKQIYRENYSFLLIAEESNLDYSTMIQVNTRQGSKIAQEDIKFNLSQLYLCLKEKEQDERLTKRSQLVFFNKIHEEKNERSKKRLIIEAKLMYKLSLSYIFNVQDKFRRDKLYFIEDVMRQEENYVKYKEISFDCWYLFVKYKDKAYHKKHDIDRRYQLASTKKEFHYQMLLSCYRRYCYINKIAEVLLCLEKKRISLLIIHKYSLNIKEIYKEANIDQSYDIPGEDYIITLIIATIEEQVIFYHIEKAQLNQYNYLKIVTKKIFQDKIAQSFVAVLVFDDFLHKYDWNSLNRFIHIMKSKRNSRVYILNFTSFSFQNQIVYEFILQKMKQAALKIPQKRFFQFANSYISSLLSKAIKLKNKSI